MVIFLGEDYKYHTICTLNASFTLTVMTSSRNFIICHFAKINEDYGHCK